MSNVVVVKKRSTDNNRYHASLKDHPEIWAAGSSIKEAVGDLVISHPENFGITIEAEG